MRAQAEEISYYTMVAGHSAGNAAQIADSLCEKGASLHGFWTSRSGDGQFQLNIVPENADAFARIASGLGLDTGVKKGIFVVRTSDEELTDVLKRLSENNVSVTSIQAMASVSNGVLLAVDPAEVRKTAELLDATGSRGQISEDVIDESSEESFPASDPPSWNAGGTAG